MTKTKTKHTPGPWSVENFGDVVTAQVTVSKGKIVKDNLCHLTCSIKTNAAREANANLIAAAPEMLDALRNAADVIDGLMAVLEKHGINDPVYPIGLKPNLARKVIRKAMKVNK